MEETRRDLAERLFRFASNAILACRELPQAPEYKVITYQLIKSASSGGANYEEAQGSVSSADFSNKIGIALKEIREANYWIRLIIDISAPNEKWKPLLQESEELKKILGAIYSKTSKPR
ncbi:MAG: four helix bundle protein [Lewinellaceae bacterium]|nr:four helix bundle protein [Lewinellaceae bacterium]